MTQKVLSHTAGHVKRLARKIRKSEQITQSAALDKAAVSLGFPSWKQFLKLSVKTPKLVERTKPNAKNKLLPNPLVLDFYFPFVKKKEKRPNTQMPIPMHQDAGKLLKALFYATRFHKRANRPVADVRNYLDEWIQCEYTDRNELSDEIFFPIYFGDDDTLPEYSPSKLRNEELIAMVVRVKEILNTGYHDCRPRQLLINRLDQSIAALGNWPPSARKRLQNEYGKLIAPGTFVRIKGSSEVLIVKRHDFSNGIVYYYGDKADDNRNDRDISVIRDQDKFRDFMPKRITLPFGMWTCNDGSQVLFNLDYMPIWKKERAGVVSSIDPDTWVLYNEEPQFFFEKSEFLMLNDPNVYLKSQDMMRQWGVTQKQSQLMKLFSTVIQTVEWRKLTEKNPMKMYPSNLR